MFALALFSVVLMGTQKASAGDPGVYTSNVELSTEGGTSVYNDGNVIIGDVEYPAIKMGTGSKSGEWFLTVPAGTTELSFYAVSWKGKACTLTIEGAAADPIQLALTSNEGASNNGPYTIVPNAETEFYTLSLEGITADTQLTFSTAGTNSGEQRCIIWGVNAAAAPEPAPGHDPVALLTDASQFSSNASDSSEGKNLGALIDGDINTIWHSDWHGVCTDPYHYLQVALNVSYEGYVILDITRRNNDNDHPSKFLIEGSNDGETFTEITTIDVPFNGAGTVEKVAFEVPSIQAWLRHFFIRCILNFAFARKNLSCYHSCLGS